MSIVVILDMLAVQCFEHQCGNLELHIALELGKATNIIRTGMMCSSTFLEEGKWIFFGGGE